MVHVTRREWMVGVVAGAGWVAVARGGARPEDGAREFLAAVAAGDEGVVRGMLGKKPALVGVTDEVGRSVLVLAFAHGHEGVARVLLEHGAEVGIVEAVMIPDWERARALIDAEPGRLDAWHPVGGTVLYAAARAGREGLWRLQSWGAEADGNPRGERGVTPAYGALECVSEIGALGAVVELLSNGADVNAPQRGGDSLLHVAARRGDERILRYVLRRGAAVDARDAKGETPLDHALREGKAAAAELLRHPDRVPRDDMRLRYEYDASGAPVEWPDLSDVPREKQGAVTGPSHNDLAAVRAAVGDDARLSFSRSSQDELAVEACAHTGNREILRYHLDHGVPMSLCTAISLGDLERARALLTENPSSVHERGPHDFAPMWYPAIGGGSVEAAELLLERGCPIEQESRGTTGLHWAAARGAVDLAAFLAEQGADLDAVGYTFDRAGQTPLRVAEERGRDEVARLLRDLGAS